MSERAAVRLGAISIAIFLSVAARSPSCTLA